MVREAHALIQKLLALLLSLVLALTGSLPSGILPGEEADPQGDHIDVSTRPDARDDPRPLNVAWTEIDGQTVEEDRWGVGEVDRIAFEVGVHVSPSATLGIAGDEVELTPTDVIVLENFDGRFKFQRVGTADETLLLDGVVKRTSVADAEGSRVTTESAREAGGASSSPGSPSGSVNASDVEHVVIRNEPVDGVSIARGEADRVTTEGPRAPEPVNVLATWVTVEDEPIDSSVSGQGPLESVIFQVGAYPEDRQPRLNVSGETRSLEPGTKVRLDGFRGSYLVYTVKDGHRVRLNGIAEDVTIPDNHEDVLDGSRPVAAFGYTPSAPATNDTILFQDRSYDPDGGRQLLHEWDFGDGTISIEQNPRHSYDEPGNYRVTLEVTDDELTSNVTSTVVSVANTPPQADFEWHPSDPTDVETVQFTSNAADSDGEVVEHHWDFDDGTTATGAQPDHAFPDDGNYEVTLTATDNSGGTSDVTRVVSVRNVAPDVDFTWDPEPPAALDAVEFTSHAQDPDGSVEDLTWTFGDGTSASGPNPTHQFADDGTYEVTLEARDDDDDASSTTKEVRVENRLPEVDFTVETPDPVTGEPVQFREDAVDRDGSISSYSWDFGDGNTSRADDPSHAFGAATTYQVTLEVTDEQGASNSTSKIVDISNAPPRVDFLWNPDEPYDQNEVSFSDLTVDPDGLHDIESWHWVFGDGNASTDRNPTNVFPDDGTYNVSLSVEDSAGHNVTENHDVVVRNQPPEVDSIDIDPERPSVRDNITMEMTASDPDGEVVGYEWELPDGTVLDGRVVNTTLPEGDHIVEARPIDDDGARGLATEFVRVSPAVPIANFTWQPQPAAAGQTVQFLDTSDPGSAPIDRWKWEFDDGTLSEEQNPNHTFPQPGTYEVALFVEDEEDRQDITRKDVTVTAPPDVEFTHEPQEPSADETVVFNATGHDPDGEIVNWTWSLGDGSVAFGQNVTHAYDDHGVYTVELVATDDAGATGAAVDAVEVINNPPDVSFSHEPALPMAGTQVNFTDHSTDPDGTVEERIWSFGDGNQAAGEEVDHTYDISGLYTVTLEAVDDLGKVGTGDQQVPVTSPHEVTLEVQVIYPTGQPIDFTNVPLTTSFEASHTGVVAGPQGNNTVDETEDGISRATFDAGEWVAGEPITWTIAGPEIPTRTLTFEPSAADFLVEKGPVTIVVPVDDVLELDPAQSTFLGQGDSTRYTDPTEPVTGNVTLTWATGVPVRNASVDLEVKYDDVDRDGTVAGALQRYATLDLDTGDDGRAPFTVPPTLTGDTSLYLPGWYELTARAVFDSGQQKVRVHEVTHFEEDPAGLTALLLFASVPEPPAPAPGTVVSDVVEATR